MIEILNVIYFLQEHSQKQLYLAEMSIWQNVTNCTNEISNNSSILKKLSEFSLKVWCKHYVITFTETFWKCLKLYLQDILKDTFLTGYRKKVQVSNNNQYLSKFEIMKRSFYCYATIALKTTILKL